MRVACSSGRYPGSIEGGEVRTPGNAAEGPSAPKRRDGLRHLCHFLLPCRDRIRSRSGNLPVCRSADYTRIARTTMMVSRIASTAETRIRTPLAIPL